jgi:hypothetical protein
MSLFIDLKYLRLISNRLPFFKQKDDRLFNIRCTICGDSQKKKSRARGYFYAVKNDLFYKCHNCGASMAFGSFLKQFDSLQYKQYVFERFSDGVPNNKPHKEPDLSFFKTEEPKERRLIDKLLDSLDKLPDDNEAVVFASNRKIPKSKFNTLYYIDDIRKINQLSEKYKERLKTDEPRMVIPFYDSDDKLVGVTCRALRGEELRYVTIKIDDDAIQVFNINNVDKSKTIYVTEGPLDSLFLDNAIAVTGTSFNKLEQLNLNKDKLVVIIDNQPRNKEVVKLYNSMIDKGYSVVIWPQTLQEKDINDMVLSGKDVKKIVKQNTFSGLEAKTKFISWKRV